MLEKIDLKRTEFWGATVLYAFALILLLIDVSNSNMVPVWTPYRQFFWENHLHYSYSKNYFFPQVARLTGYYGAFLLWNFVTIPCMLVRRRMIWGILLIPLLLGALWLLLTVTDTWLRRYLFEIKTADYAHNLMIKQSLVTAVWALIALAGYTFAKRIIANVLTRIAQLLPQYSAVAQNVFLALVVWGAVGVGIVIFRTVTMPILQGMGIVLFSILLYGLSFTILIEDALKKGVWGYLLRIAGICVGVGLLLFVVAGTGWRQREAMWVTVTANGFFQVFICAPLYWLIYQRNLTMRRQLTSLQTALGSSSANLDFLRSQINPHFLFNALNTLYGTALQESAERTGEGIQRLGDMMRFMLRENTQDKILLAREIEYLQNYVALQTLRIQSSPDITISQHIEEDLNGLYIAPMLLIPFVENAFKHGISLRKPSQVVISLQIREGTLYFDVRNTVHEKQDHDIEADKNGIGLENVRLRLQLLYPQKHELVVRQTTLEFFVHVTVQLTEKV
ncbi:sensor histidine kinase [Dawidia soli]|nr:histidine kinase [Dawidia soli]